VLLLADHETDRFATSQLLRTVIPGLEVREASDHVGFFAALKEPPFDLVISDTRLHWSTGAEIVNAVASLQPGTPVMMVASQNEDVDEEAGGLTVLRRGPDFGRRLLAMSRELLDLGEPSAEGEAGEDGVGPDRGAAVERAARESGSETVDDATDVEPLDDLLTALGMARVHIAADGCIVEASRIDDHPLVAVPTGPVTLADGDWSALRATLERDGRVQDARVRVVDAQGVTRALHLTLTRAGDGGGRGVAWPASLRSRVEEALRWTAVQYRAIFEGSLAPSVVLDDDGTVAMVNRAFETLVGRDRHEIEDRMTWSEMLALENVETERADHRTRVESGEREPWRTELRIVDASGESIPVVAREVLLPDTGRIAISIVDQRDRLSTQEEVLRAAFHDPVTDLPNRLALLDRLEDLCERGTGPGPGLLLVDLDRFKVVNDGLGHRAADELLQAAADRLANVLGSREPLACAGGDVFAAVLDELPRADHAQTTAMRIREAFATPFRLGDRKVFLSVSVGVAVRDGELDADGLLRRAETALHRAKRDGRDRWVLSEPALDEATQRDFEIENGLRRALAGDELDLEYQPVVSLDDGRVVAFEALLRWDHPESGRLKPDRFLRVAEESGLIRLIDRWVLARACEDLAAVESASNEGDRPWLGVNLAPSTLEDPGLVDHLRESLTQAGQDGDGLVLEMAAGGNVMADARARADTLEALQGLGVGLCLNRFGGAGTLLGSLGDVHFGLAKLDPALVADAGDDDDHWRIVEAVLGVASRLGLDVVATGVESEAHAERLRDLGCHLAQGLRYSEPVSRDRIPELLGGPLPPSGG
jgi:diguanylate cyclase (GGDEF)-like protein/PAS domain S-box-containing protein